jgi:hypothetical protein
MKNNTVSSLKYGDIFSFSSKVGVKYKVTEMSITYMRYSLMEDDKVKLGTSFYKDHPKCSSRKIVKFN